MRARRPSLPLLGSEKEKYELLFCSLSVAKIPSEYKVAKWIAKLVKLESSRREEKGRHMAYAQQGLIHQQPSAKGQLGKNNRVGSSFHWLCSCSSFVAVVVVLPFWWGGFQCVDRFFLFLFKRAPLVCCMAYEKWELVGSPAVTWRRVIDLLRSSIRGHENDSTRSLDQVRWTGEKKRG